MAAVPVPRPWGEGPFEEWKSWREISRPAYAPITELLLDAAALRPGARVLDLACGTGVPALEEAERVLPGGTVVGVDLSETSLELAARFARLDGRANVEFRRCDAHELPFDDMSFDRITSRFGPMYFRDPTRALRDARRLLVPSGRVAWLVWGPYEEQPYFRAMLEPLRHGAGLAQLPPEARQPFRFGEGGALLQAAEAAGLTEVRESRHVLPYRWGVPPDTLVDRWWRATAPPFQPLIEPLSSSERDRVRDEMLDGLRQYWNAGELRTTACVLLLTAAHG